MPTRSADEDYEDNQEYEDNEDEYVDAEVTTAAAAAQAALDHLGNLIGKQSEGVVAVEPEQHGWTVSVEVVEDRRIPSSADVLAIYQAVIDPAGDLASYRRTSRYARGQGDPGGGR
ncbi:MAG TPA: gas vesicle protein GvpO [Streptosporangiaceae bacterium]|nr:gas vesicle protein GvpO [Streptosporangiaceae bacterium]